MLIILLAFFIAVIAVLVALYAIYIFLSTMFLEQQRVQTKSSVLEKENEKLRFEKKRMQLIINQLESDKASSEA